jgi:hypothetical protein
MVRTLRALRNNPNHTVAEEPKKAAIWHLTTDATEQRRLDLANRLKRERDIAKKERDALLVPFDPTKTYCLVTYGIAGRGNFRLLFDPESTSFLYRSRMLRQLETRVSDLIDLEDNKVAENTCLRGHWSKLSDAEEDVKNISCVIEYGVL